MRFGKQTVFDNSIKGFEALRSLGEDIQNKHGLTEVVYCLEPTASYHKPLAEYQIRKKEQVVYVSNVAVAKNRGLLDDRWDKNDNKDAANVDYRMSPMWAREMLGQGKRKREGCEEG